ncbi:MAG: HEAT repeat domain-containing protein [Candidatus Poribacteria bacterium]|nr:HEAT repeat domain-containing protein [Candidatus Poribacteria bacterium]
MKKVLSDYIKSKEDFDRFCNLFLKKEVSSFVKVYDAPGRDGGIDADYTGDYKGKDGTWIFQYKFFDPTIDKARARRNLLSTVIGSKRRNGELDKANALQCDHYVLMTSTLLTAGNKRKIEDAKNEKRYTFSLTCWDAEDLITMTDEFPYLLNSFRDPHLPVFLPWQDMFQNQIAGQNRLLRYNYDTFGREDEINQFQIFVQDPEKILFMVYGSGGIGKTKLAIEFAKVIEREHSDYEPLFFQMAGDSFESALADILPNRKYIFFVDDAHDFIDNLGGIRIILNSPGYSESKAVLITRKPFKSFLESSFLTALPNNATDELEIRKLSPEKTKEFIRKYTQISDGSLLSGLAQIGRDTPLLAVMVIYLLEKGEGLGGLTQDKLVELAFESYLNDSFQEHPASSEQRRKLLEWLSGIAPIDIENNQIRDKLAEILKVEPYEVEQYRDNLKNDGLLFQYGTKQRVFPDALSDYILRKACFLSNGRPSSFHESLLKEFLPFLPVKVVINLARVENITGQKSLLDEHVDSLKTQVREGDNFVRMATLEQMEGISYFRPDDAIDIFNIIFDSPKEDSMEHYTAWTSTRTHQDVVKRIAKEVQKTVNTLSGFMKTLKIVRKLLLMDNLELPNYDSPQELLKKMTGFQTSKPGVFQTKALEVFEEWKTEDKPELSMTLLNALDSLLVLDFSETVSEGGGLKFGWHHLKYTPELTRLRATAIDLIEHCLRTSQHSTVRAEAIGSISRAINPFESPFRQGISEEEQALLRKEQVRLFNILADQISRERDFTVLNAIDGCLGGYAENRYVDGFPKERAAELLAKFRKHENYERYYFYRQFTGKFRDWDLSESPEKTQAFLRKYLQKYTPAKLSRLMQECIQRAEKGKAHRSTRDSIWAEKGWNPGSATSLLQSIGELNPSYGSDLLDHIVAWQTEESHCASGLLSGIRYVKKNKGNEATHRLLDQNTIFAKRIVVRSYLWRSKTEGCIGKEDLAILDQLSKTLDPQLRLYIAESLPNFYAVDANIVLEILVTLSSDESPMVMRQVIYALTGNALEFSPQNHLEKYKQVMLNCVRLERLDYDAEQVLRTIFKHDSIWVIKFFEKRIAYKENESKRYDSFSDLPRDLLKFDAVPHRLHSLFEDVDWNDEKAMDALRRVRDWIRTSSNLLRLEAPNLLVSMLSGNAPRNDEIKINPAMRKLFEEWIDSEDVKLIKEVAYLMRGFDADTVFYSLAESILIKSAGDKQAQGEIVAALYSGVYSRNFGDPAPHLLKRIKDLKVLRDRTQSPIVTEFAEDLIKMTEQDIEKQAQEDEEFLEGEEW